MKSPVVLTLVVLLLSTAGTRPANASCVEPNLADQVARADVIVYGSVSRSAQLPIFPPGRQVRFRVERVFKGIAAAEMNVQLGPDGGAAATSVDYQADDGTAHTLYLRRAGDVYSTDACSGSHPGTPSAEETTLLGGGELRIVTNHQPVSWTLPVSVAILVALIAGGGVLLWRRRRRTIEGSGPIIS
ncbi:MAG: hypothetical protein M3T56_00195 [Chloroflexota bacterium]|nr:hypothetical protein [Chloroflexota bacterium]